MTDLARKFCELERRRREMVREVERLWNMPYRDVAERYVDAKAALDMLTAEAEAALVEAVDAPAPTSGTEVAVDAELVGSIDALLFRLADAWDPRAGVEATVLNSDLERASSLLSALRRSGGCVHCGGSGSQATYPCPKCDGSGKLPRRAEKPPLGNGE